MSSSSSSSSSTTTGEKRKHSSDDLPSNGATSDDRVTLSKKQRTESNETTALVTTAQPAAKDQQLVPTTDGTLATQQLPPRTSSLESATMCLTGHAAAILTCQFSADGRQIASGGVDKLLFLWDLSPTTGECINTNTLTGHDGSILDCVWNGNEQVITASSDKNGAVWDVETATRIKRLRGHTGIVNSVDVTRRGLTKVITGSDDCTVKLWDLRIRHSVEQWNEHYQILSTVFSDDGTQIFTAGISNDIKCYDLRTNRLLFSLIGHRDSVTGLSISPDGSYLLSNGMDSTLRCWDVRPYVAAPTRLTCIYKGHTHDLEQNLLRCAWNMDGTKVTAGSADQTVNIWDANSSQLLYRLPGHKASVNEVVFHPKENIVLSASSDKTMWIGEI